MNCHIWRENDKYDRRDSYDGSGGSGGSDGSDESNEVPMLIGERDSSLAKPQSRSANELDENLKNHGVHQINKKGAD